MSRLSKKKVVKKLFVSNVDDFVDAIEQSKHIIVVAGAGISVSCGIPDFRSKTTGLYNSLDCQKVGIPSPELLFDFDYFKLDPAPFYKFANSLLPNDLIKPSLSHWFISLLERKKKLLRVYTQNVDGLERKAGISNVVECHGSMAEFYCLSCKKRQKLGEELMQSIRNGTVCYCNHCRSGLMKPAITFFGENVPHVFEKSVKKDFASCDLVIVMGTSLKVGGSVQELLSQIGNQVPRALINKDIVDSSTATFDVSFNTSLIGDCDCIVQYLCYRLNWNLEIGVASTVEDITLEGGVEDKLSQSPVASENISVDAQQDDVETVLMLQRVCDKGLFKSEVLVSSQHVSSPASTGIEIEVIEGKDAEVELSNYLLPLDAISDNGNAMSSPSVDLVVVSTNNLDEIAKTPVVGHILVNANNTPSEEDANDVNTSRFGRKRRARFTAAQLDSGIQSDSNANACHNTSSGEPQTSDASQIQDNSSSSMNAFNESIPKPSACVLVNPSVDSWICDKIKPRIFYIDYSNDDTSGNNKGRKRVKMSYKQLLPDSKKSKPKARAKTTKKKRNVKAIGKK